MNTSLMSDEMMDAQYAYNMGYEDGANARPNRELKVDWRGCEDDYAEGYSEGLSDLALVEDHLELEAERNYEAYIQEQEREFWRNLEANEDTDDAQRFYEENGFEAK